jgi:hypothetical protein
VKERARKREFSYGLKQVGKQDSFIVLAQKELKAKDTTKKRRHE